MNGFAEYIAIFLVVAGPGKAVALFASAASQMGWAERIKIAVKSVLIAGIILFVFAFAGQSIIKFFHVSVPALLVAVGVILFIFALQIVLGSGGGDDVSPPDPQSIAIYPLAMPLLASPQAIVAAVVITSKMADASAKLPVFLALGAVLFIDLVAMVGTAVMMKDGDGTKKGGGVAEVLLRVVAIMLCALAVELVVEGLRGFGVDLPRMTQ